MRLIMFTSLSAVTPVVTVATGSDFAHNPNALPVAPPQAVESESLKQPQIFRRVYNPTVRGICCMVA
jgi:hypothetical protein